MDKMDVCPRCGNLVKLRVESSGLGMIECSDPDCCIQTYLDYPAVLIKNWNTRCPAPTDTLPSWFIRRLHYEYYHPGIDVNRSLEYRKGYTEKSRFENRLTKW